MLQYFCMQSRHHVVLNLPLYIISCPVSTLLSIMENAKPEYLLMIF